MRWATDPRAGGQSHRATKTSSHLVRLLLLPLLNNVTPEDETISTFKLKVPGDQPTVKIHRRSTDEERRGKAGLLGKKKEGHAFFLLVGCRVIWKADGPEVLGAEEETWQQTTQPRSARRWQHRAGMAAGRYRTDRFVWLRSLSSNGSAFREGLSSLIDLKAF